MKNRRPLKEKWSKKKLLSEMLERQLDETGNEYDWLSDEYKELLASWLPKDEDSESEQDLGGFEDDVYNPMAAEEFSQGHDGEAEDFGQDHSSPRTPIEFPENRAAEELIPHPRGLIYRDEFAFGNNAVVRFGINSRNVAVDNERQTLAGESVTFYSSESAATSQGSTRSSRQSSRKSEDIKTSAEAVVHHPLEIHLITESVRYLFDEESRKTVLVDIFARKEGSINLQNQEVTVVAEDGSESNSTIAIPETHTIVLYKNPPSDGKHTVLVIDPSSFAFSSHLSNLNERLKSEFGNLENIVTLHKNLQLYKSNGEEVPYFHLYRDCIDVAAKLAFNFNTPSDHLHVDLMRIVEYAPIKAISNIPKIDKTILDTDIPTRIKQTSNVEVVHQFNTIEKVLGRNFQILRRLDEATHDKSRYDHTELLKTSDTMQTIIGKLAVQNQIVITCISDNLNSEQGEIMELIGDIT